MDFVDKEKASVSAPEEVIKGDSSNDAVNGAVVTTEGNGESGDSTNADASANGGALPKLDIKACCGLPWCTNKKDLQVCSACGFIAYCSRPHQVEHFKEGGHKLICTGTKREGGPMTFGQCKDEATRLFSEQKWDASLPFFGAMLELTERTLGKMEFSIVPILDSLSACYQKMGKLDKAAHLLQRLIILFEIYQRDNLEDSRTSFTYMGRLAEIYIRIGHFKLAHDMLQKTAEMAGEVFGSQSFEKGRALCSLGTCVHMAGEVDADTKAESILLEAVALEGYGKATERSQMVAASDCFFNLGMIQEGMNKFEEAHASFKSSLELKIKAGLPSSDPDIVQLKESIVAMKSKGRF